MRKLLLVLLPLILLSASGSASLTHFWDFDDSNCPGTDNLGSVEANCNGGVSPDTPAINNTGFKLDGSSGYLNVSEIDGEIQPPITIATVLNVSSINSKSFIFSHGGTRFLLSHERIGSNGWEFNIYDGSSHHTLSSGSSDTGKMSMVGMWDGSTMEFVFNGTYVGNKSVSSIGESRDNTHIGAGFDPSDFTKWFNGTVDDTRIYDNALTEQEAKDLHNSYDFSSNETGNGRDRAEEIKENAKLNSAELDVSHAVVGELNEVFGRLGSPEKLDASDLPRGDVLVLDCEGAEKKILQSLPEDSFDRVVVETHSRFDAPREEVVRILEETGFEVEDVLVDESSPERSIIVSRRSEGIFTGKDLENRLSDVGEKVEI